MEDIIEIPTHVRGAFFVSSYDNDIVDLIIKDPLGHIIKELKGKSESLFYFDAQEKGTYEFTFLNRNVLNL